MALERCGCVIWVVLDSGETKACFLGHVSSVTDLFMKKSAFICRSLSGNYVTRLRTRKITNTQTLLFLCFWFSPSMWWATKSAGMITTNILESYLGPVPGPRDDAGLYVIVTLTCTLETSQPSPAFCCTQTCAANIYFWGIVPYGGCFIYPVAPPTENSRSEIYYVCLDRRDKHVPLPSSDSFRLHPTKPVLIVLGATWISHFFYRVPKTLLFSCSDNALTPSLRCPS